MLLVVDIGNTSVHVGVFDGERLLDTWRLTTDVNRLRTNMPCWSAESWRPPACQGTISPNAPQ